MGPKRTLRLAEVLTRSLRPVTPIVDTEYPQLTVRLHHRGVTLRRLVRGAELTASSQYRASGGQLIISRIDARNGAIGVVPPELDGGLVTNDFWLFDVNDELVVPAYLDLIAGTEEFIERCRSASEGTTNRVRLQLNRFMDFTVEVPSLDAQRATLERLVDLERHLERLRQFRDVMKTRAPMLWASALSSAFGRDPRATCENDARELLATQSREYATVTRSTFNNAHPGHPTILDSGPHELPTGWIWTNLGSVLTDIVDCVNDTPDFVDEPTGLVGLKAQNIRPYELDLSTKWYVSPEDFASWNRRVAPKAGDIVVTREAPVGNACILSEGLTACLTQRLVLLRADPEFVAPSYILHFINSPLFLNQVVDARRGLTTPHLRVADIPRILVPMPDRTTQERTSARLDSLRGHFTRLTALQDSASSATDALKRSSIAYALDSA